MSLCIIYSTITVSNANSNKYTVTQKIVHLSWFLLVTLLGHITSVNNVVVAVLYLLRALHRRIIVYRIL